MKKSDLPWSRQIENVHVSAENCVDFIIGIKDNKINSVTFVVWLLHPLIYLLYTGDEMYMYSYSYGSLTSCFSLPFIIAGEKAI